MMNHSFCDDIPERGPGRLKQFQKCRGIGHLSREKRRNRRDSARYEFLDVDQRVLHECWLPASPDCDEYVAADDVAASGDDDSTDSDYAAAVGIL